MKGLERGKNDFGVEYGLIICAMRNMQLSQEMAELAVDFRERGVVGFDLAGEEGGFPPKKHVDAFHYIQRENFNITIHAGEAFGKESIWQAIQWCGAHRIGHATRLIEDIGLDDHDPTKIVKMGYLAQYVLDKRIPLEICLSSNVRYGRGGEHRQASLRHLLPVQLPRHAEHRRPPDERHDDDEGIQAGPARCSSSASTTSRRSRSTR